MTPEEIKQRMRLYDAVREAFYTARIKPLPDYEEKILQHIAGLGVVAEVADAGYLILRQDQTQMAVSQACETIRQSHPEWFISSAKDRVVCREDLDRGSATERVSARSAWIAAHGLEAWEKLPRTRAEAERKAIIPDPSMTAAQYVQLSVSEKSRLAAALGVDGVRKIMARKN